jgi:hypothetical protein
MTHNKRESEIEQMQRFIRIIATMPPEVQTALRVLAEWTAEQDN